MTFAEFYLERRKSIASQAQYCRDNGLTTSAVCFIERGTKKPPLDPSVIAKHAKALGLKEKSDDWYLFYDLAAAENGVLPAYITKAKPDKVAALFAGMRVELKKSRQL